MLNVNYFTGIPKPNLKFAIQKATLSRLTLKKEKTILVFDVILTKNLKIFHNFDVNFVSDVESTHISIQSGIENEFLQLQNVAKEKNALSSKIFKLVVVIPFSMK